MHVGVPFAQTQLTNHPTSVQYTAKCSAGNFIQLEDSNNIIATSLGNKDLDEQVFQPTEEEGKKKYFKIRLTSKKTGKKIDFNLNFLRSHVKTQEQEDSTSMDPC